MKRELKKVTTMTKSKKALSTFEREMKDAKFKKAFDESYREFLFSELLISIMEEDDISVRNLAKEVGVSPTIIQKLRSGKQADLKVTNFISILKTFGYKMIIEKENERFEVKKDKKDHLNFVHPN